MKKLFLFFIFLFMFSFVDAKQVEYPDEIVNVLEVFINCLNNNDEDIYTVIDLNNTQLINDINNQINDINVTYEIINVKNKDENYFRIKTRFNASGDNWSTSGFTSWYDIKLIDGGYKITDTNLFNKVGLEYISKAVLIAFLAAGVIFVLPFLFIFFRIVLYKKRQNNTVILSNVNKPL